MERKVRNFNRRYPSEYNIFRTIFYLVFVSLVVTPYLKMFYKFEVFGRENIPKDKKNGKYLYTANHVSTLDPPILSMAIFKPIAYMAKKELFEEGEKLAWLIKRLGAFAVDRSKPEIATFKTVKDVLSTSWSLGVFPQGGIRPYGEIGELKKGFIVIAKNANADIIPVAISGFDGYPKLKPFTRKNFSVHIGTPISHKLSVDEILNEWSKHIAEHADYKLEFVEPQKEDVAS